MRPRDHRRRVYCPRRYTYKVHGRLPHFSHRNSEKQYKLTQIQIVQYGVYERAIVSDERAVVSVANLIILILSS